MADEPIMKPNPRGSTPEEAPLRRLADMPVFPILLGETPVTRLASPLRVAETERLKLQVSPASPVSIKRDDLTPGFGNKARKLELILSEVQAQGADSVITAGGPQSNHCRQTAQFARELGIEAHLMFGTSTGERDFPCTGNQVVNRLFGAPS